MDVSIPACPTAEQLTRDRADALYCMLTYLGTEPTPHTGETSQSRRGEGRERRASCCPWIEALEYWVGAQGGTDDCCELMDVITIVVWCGCVVGYDPLYVGHCCWFGDDTEVPLEPSKHRDTIHAYILKRCRHTL